MSASLQSGRSVDEERARIQAHDLSDPRKEDGRIADVADMLDAASRQQITQEIRRIEGDVKGSRVLIVTVHDVPAGQTPKQFATALFNKWGIGSKQRGNGVLVVVVKNAKRVEIEVGEGIEQRFDNSWCTSMLKAEVIPSFKQGKFGAGVLHGVEQIGERLRGGSEFYGSKSESVAEIAKTLLLGGVAIVLPGGGSSGSASGSDSDGGCSSGGGGGGASW